MFQMTCIVFTRGILISNDNSQKNDRLRYKLLESNDRLKGMRYYLRY